MSAQVSSAGNNSTNQKLAVSFRLLLSLYLIIPVCLLIQLCDNWFWQRTLAENLPSSPSHYLLFQILFGTPHIIASTIVLVSNSEYLNFYKTKLIVMTMLIIVVFGLGSLIIPYRVLYLIVAFWTVFHVLKQQHGISRGICRLPSWGYHSMLWLSVAGGFSIYVGIFLNSSLDTQHSELIKQLAAGLCIALIFTAALCQHYVTTTFGKLFLWSNVCLVISSFYLYVQHYYFFAILVPRLVHDATAYLFYVTHDYNKHYNHPQNFLYRQTQRCHLHIFIVLPAFSFLLTFVLQAYGDSIINTITNSIFGMEIRKAVTLGLLGYLGLMHYYTEAFTWKQDSPYRKYIAFTKA
ncbi:MAG: hypothetical protein HOP23_06750 [Methylococcaceae bacterium]|nr:hypothetical protein [Methylococcaceae bacterium]